MSGKAHGQIRRGQVITTYGPGALIDLPRHSAVVGGLDTWSRQKAVQLLAEILNQKSKWRFRRFRVSRIS